MTREQVRPGRWAVALGVLVLLALLVVAVVGSGVVNTALAIGIAAIPNYARLLRGQALVLLRAEYAEAARMLGVSPLRSRSAPSEQWLAKFTEVAAVLGEHATEHERTGKTPHSDVEVLKATGLVTLLGPAEHGGGGQAWSTAHRVVRTISSADGSVGHVLAQHYVWAWLAEFIGMRRRRSSTSVRSLRAQWLFGGSSRVRKATLEIDDAGADVVFSGEIPDPVRCQVSDIVMLEGRIPGQSTPISALAMASEPGFGRYIGRDGIGLRRSTAGPLKVDHVAIRGPVRWGTWTSGSNRAATTISST